MLVDPQEEEIIRACARAIEIWCIKLRDELNYHVGNYVKDVIFFSFHRGYDLTIGWSGAEREDRPILLQRARYVVQPGYGGLSRLFIHEGAPKNAGLYLEPEKKEVPLKEWFIFPDHPKPEKIQPPSTKDKVKTLDVHLRSKLRGKIGNRLYLPVQIQERNQELTRVGALMVSLRGGPKTRKIVFDKLCKMVEFYESWKDNHEFHEAMAVIDPIWKVIWMATRESRTLLPHQGSFKRVLKQVTSKSFAQNRSAVIEVAHFDINDFKKLNELVGYQNADAVVEYFVQQLCMRLNSFTERMKWPNPVTCAEGAWLELKQSAKVGIYLSRIGGDEFGFICVSERGVFKQVAQDVIESAAQVVDNQWTDLLSKDKKEVEALNDNWTFCMMGGALAVKPFEVDRLNEESVDALWDFCSALSQAVKREFKYVRDKYFLPPGRLFAYMTIEDYLNHCRIEHIFKISEEMNEEDLTFMQLNGLSEVWELPLPELQRIHHYGIRVLGEEVHIIAKTARGTLICV